MGDQLIIAVDVDEVCADLLTEWLRIYNLEYEDSVRPEDITDWDIERFVRCGKGIYRFLSRPGFYYGVRPIPGALEAVEQLRALGRVIFVTSCADGTMDDKLAWLRREGFLSQRRAALFDFIACRDKWLIGADVLLDDAVHNVEAFRGAAFLVGHFHNQTTPCRRERIANLAAAPARVAQLVAEKAALEEKACGQPLSWPNYRSYLGGR